MNPFKNKGQIMPVASINSVYIDDIKASELFRPALLVKKLEEKRELLGFSREITGEKLIFAFNKALNSDIPSIKMSAESIATQFGDKLAKVITTLKKPSLLSIQNRDNWNKIHWDYWKSIEKLYLVGGLTSPILTKVFYECINKALKSQEINNFTVVFIEGSSNLGTIGLSTEVVEGEHLLFDFGQTNIKRAHHIKKNEVTVIDNILSSIPSDFLFYKHNTEEELIMIAKKLDNFIQAVILDTMKQVGYKGNTILMGIANYIDNGIIYSARGGYGKLAYIAGNYGVHLSEKLSQSTNRSITVKLYHDTSAMALQFKSAKKTAVISLGTAFGVAFPE